MYSLTGSICLFPGVGAVHVGYRMAPRNSRILCILEYLPILRRVVARREHAYVVDDYEKVLVTSSVHGVKSIAEALP